MNRSPAHQYAVLDRKRISGKAVQIPVSDGAHVHKERRDVKPFRQRDASADQVVRKPFATRIGQSSVLLGMWVS